MDRQTDRQTELQWLRCATAAVACKNSNKSNIFTVWQQKGCAK